MGRGSLALGALLAGIWGGAGSSCAPRLSLMEELQVLQKLISGTL